MARINVEDELEQDPRFRALVRRLDGDDEKALGKLIQFWRVAQKFWGRDQALVPEEVFALGDWEVLISVCFAERRDAGVYAKGAESRFAWYLQKCRFARKGRDAQNPRARPSANPSTDSSASPIVRPPPVLALSPYPDKSEVESEIGGCGGKEAGAPKRRSPVRPRKAPRLTTWEPEDPLARVFANLMAVRAYAAVFDTEHERRVLHEHLKAHELRIEDLEQITSDLRHWADGPKGEQIKSPRGVLNTFVKKHVERRASQPSSSSPEPKKSRLKWLKPEDFA